MIRQVLDPGEKIMLTQSFTYQLASIVEDAIGPAARLFEQRFGLDVRALRVLRLIDDQPDITFTSLAGQTKFDRGATSRIVWQLIKAGLIRREIDAHDARQFHLRVTAKGRRLRHDADPLSLELEALILSALSEAEREQFRAMLGKLTAWLSGQFADELAQRYPEALAEKQRGAVKETPPLPRRRRQMKGASHAEPPAGAEPGDDEGR